MKKKTIVTISLTLVLALLAVAVIATFPTYLFEDTEPSDSAVQSGTVEQSEGGQGDDVGILAGDEDDNNGAEAVLPTADDKELGYSEEPESKLETVAKAKNVKVIAEAGAFDKGTKVKIKKLGALDKAYYRSRHYLRGVADKFVAYNLSAKKDGKSVSPDGTVKITFTIPQGYNTENIAVYYLVSKGVQELDFTLSKDGKTATVKVSQLGVYILAEKNAKQEQDNGSSSDTTTSSDKTDTSSNENTSSEPTSSEDNNSSDVSSDETSSDDTSSDNTSSDNTSSVDPDKESMNGWTPWQ